MEVKTSVGQEVVTIFQLRINKSYAKEMEK